MTDLSAKEIAVCRECGISPDYLPRHIAVIMDGNGRWAKRRFMPRTMGHRQGAESLRTVIKLSAELGVKYLSVYVFSTENWKRPNDEVSFLMGLLKESLHKETPQLHQQNVRIKVLGDLSELSPELQAQIKTSEGHTASNTSLQFNLLINYGARREITQAIKGIVADSTTGKLSEITESTLDDYLYTKGICDPDIFIRTGGDYRISNFLLWQCAYSELFFLDTLWPDFNRDKLIEVIQQFQRRDRRFGGINDDE